MKIKVKNLGVLKQSEFELGDFTIFCGKNVQAKPMLILLYTDGFRYYPKEFSQR